MLRDGVGMGCYFLTYEALVQRHLRVNGGERGDISPFYAVGFGAAAGYGLWFRLVLVPLSLLLDHHHHHTPTPYLIPNPKFNPTPNPHLVSSHIMDFRLVSDIVPRGSR